MYATQRAEKANKKLRKYIITHDGCGISYELISIYVHNQSINKYIRLVYGHYESFMSLLRPNYG